MKPTAEKVKSKPTSTLEGENYQVSLIVQQEVGALFRWYWLYQLCYAFSMVTFYFSPVDVENDIEYLYEAVPQLSTVFHILDKIGEGM